MMRTKRASQPRPRTDAQRFAATVRQRAGRLLRRNPSLAPVRAAVVDYCAARALCETLAAYAIANPGDPVAAGRALDASLERRHAYRLLSPYLPQPNLDDFIPEDERDIID